MYLFERISVSYRIMYIFLFFVTVYLTCVTVWTLLNQILLGMKLNDIKVGIDEGPAKKIKLIKTSNNSNLRRTAYYMMSLFQDYNRASRFYDNQRTAVGADVMTAMIQLNTGKHLKDLHVLDAGSGTGSYAKELLDLEVGQLRLLDASAGMLDSAKAMLNDYYAQGRVKDFVKCTMPPIPIQDSCFDAVMFNTVLNHLDRANSDYRNCIETLNETRRILRPNGVIVVTAILPETFARSMWFMQIDERLTQRFIENAVPSFDHFTKIFDAAGFTCIQKLNILGSDLLKNYCYVEDPLEEALKSNLNEYWSFATETEAKHLVQKAEELKKNGELEAWIKSHDHTNSMGILTIMICKPLYSR